MPEGHIKTGNFGVNTYFAHLSKSVVFSIHLNEINILFASTYPDTHH